jgi:hypothetical protein
MSVFCQPFRRAKTLKGASVELLTILADRIDRCMRHWKLVRLSAVVMQLN